MFSPHRGLDGGPEAARPPSTDRPSGRGCSRGMAVGVAEAPSRTGTVASLATGVRGRGHAVEDADAENVKAGLWAAGGEAFDMSGSTSCSPAATAVRLAELRRAGSQVPALVLTVEDGEWVQAQTLDARHRRPPVYLGSGFLTEVVVAVAPAGRSPDAPGTSSCSWPGDRWRSLGRALGWSRPW